VIFYGMDDLETCPARGADLRAGDERAEMGARAQQESGSSDAPSLEQLLAILDGGWLKVSRGDSSVHP
jgi:hypothetical protein